ncbi:hypothetical protein [Micromonospora sp. 4G55]|uniref:hypothetical protein n=1 Tax=Micromonospora sp. 4G55 TaxID=2806102 RepID=UPI001EE498B1|nr:hypothetical protein [Micromonospora sp. 4G55]
MKLQPGREAVVRVAVATLWATPEAVRPVDRPALAPRTDIPAWVAGMDTDQRVGECVLSQLLLGERVLVTSCARTAGPAWSPSSSPRRNSTRAATPAGCPPPTWPPRSRSPPPVSRWWSTPASPACTPSRTARWSCPASSSAPD